MLLGVHHVAVICSDYERSKAFYVDILGMEIVHELYREERNSYKLDLRVGETEIELFSFPNPPQRLSHPEATGARHIAFTVKDIDEMVAYLESKDVACEEIRVGPVTGNRYTFFPDPDYLPIELVEV